MRFPSFGGVRPGQFGPRGLLVPLLWLGNAQQNPRLADSTASVSVGCSSAATIGLAAVASSVVSVGGSATAIIPTFARQIKLTVDHTQVGGSDLTNFAVFVKVTSADLKSVANGGRIANSGATPNDLVFAANATGAGVLDYKVIAWDGATGDLTAWVRLSSISASVDTDFYIVYADSTVSTSAGDNPAVWTAFTAVYLMEGGFGIESKRRYDGTVTGATQTTGQIGDALLFDGGGDRLETSADAALGITSDGTLSAWINSSDWGLSNATIFKKNGNYILRGESPNLVAYLWDGTNLLTASCTLPATGSWRKIDAVYAGNAISAIYFDATSQTLTPANLGAFAQVLTNMLSIGHKASPANDLEQFYGSIDQATITIGVARTQGWITAEWNNQKTGSTFLTAAAAADTPSGISATSSQSVSVSSTAAASLTVAADSSAQVPVAPTSVVALTVAASSTASVPIAVTATAVVESHADSTQAVLVAPAATATVSLSAASTADVPIASAAAAGIETHADSAMQVPVTSSAAATVSLSAASTAQVPIASTSVVAIEDAASSTQLVPVNSIAATTIDVSAASTQLVPVTSAAAAAVGVAADSAAQVPVSPVAVTTIETHGDSTATVPIASAATATVDVSVASVADVPITSVAEAGLLVLADSTATVPITAADVITIGAVVESTAEVPIGASGTFEITDSIISADSTAEVPIGSVSEAAVGVTADSIVSVPILPLSIVSVITQAASTMRVSITPTSTATILTHAVSLMPVMIGGTITVTILVRADSECEVGITGRIHSQFDILAPCPPIDPIEIGGRPDSGSGPAEAILVTARQAATPVAVAQRIAAEPVRRGERPCASIGNPFPDSWDLE